MTSTLIKITDLIADIKLDHDPSFSYWNDAEKEKTKAFNVEIGFDKLEKSPHLNDIFNQLNVCIKLSSINEEGQEILSLGSRTCWLESWWLKGIEAYILRVNK